MSAIMGPHHHRTPVGLMVVLMIETVATLCPYMLCQVIFQRSPGWTIYPPSGQTKPLGIWTGDASCILYGFHV